MVFKKEKTENSPPEPHPLDYDWKFSTTSVEAIINILPMKTPIIALGTPSIAEHLSSIGKDVILIDRQPFQRIRNHLSLEIDCYTPPISGRPIAIMDPPWYPDYFREWIYWCARSVDKGGVIYASTWPPSTRPTAKAELLKLFYEISKWGHIELLDIDIHYEIPQFEKAASLESETSPLSRSPRLGNLLKITVFQVPSIAPPPPMRKEWRRFVYNDYQIALRVGLDYIATPGVFPITGSHGWKWPYVSRRAPNREKIDIWSSHNEVAAAKNLNAVEQAFRQLLNSKSGTDFEAAFAQVPQLKSWEIPRPPYWRTHEWAHHQ